ncbi:MAG: spermidine/putrescine ABC transporter substrate-binding protein [Bryobacteraceae bacterium]
MNRRLFLMGVAGAAGCSRESRPRLNVYNWSDYVAPDTISNFEQEFGVSVRYGVFESAPELLAKVMTGNSGWDVVFPPNDYIQPMREMDLVARLRHDWLKNLDQLEPQFLRPPWDPDLTSCVPYMHGSTGIVYQKSVEPISAWADLWSDRLRGRITMIDDPIEVFGACLKKLGLPLNSSDPGELRRAQKEAIDQKRLVRAYLNAEVRDQLVAGDVLAAQAWAITAQQAMDASPKLAFAHPEEGFALFADNIVILRESKRLELAHRFVDYLLRPRVNAAVVLTTKTATCNAGARRLLPESIRKNPVLYPPPEMLARAEWFAPQSIAGQRLRDRLWTEIKSA